ncbi:MAG TPA: fumarylacetoacetate hydrolase family protein [Solirubrobacteraceae bacterium]|jgi:2-dehydro-3-deoxy-D-arabinonate dehydratase|nr:fumarylacetoacetate hydrolase family protein [Solirubrobacteraceae bacterium]
MSNGLANRRLVRVADDGGTVRLAVVDGDQLGILDADDMVATLQVGSLPAVTEHVPIADAETLTPDGPWRVLVPVVAPETWAAGVTYERSREARRAESLGRDVYDLIYDAVRPELFLKDAAGRRTVGPGASIAVRSDAVWSVPEPELAVVLDAGARPLALTIGNDVSSRDIEGANPLYLPQAKIYARACALGPALLVPADWEADYEIELRILDAGGETLFEDRTSTDRMRRPLAVLTEFLRRDNPVAAGSVLLTGTGIVPPDDVTLAPGLSVDIRIPGIGVLRNPVAPATEPNHSQEAIIDV